MAFPHTARAAPANSGNGPCENVSHGWRDSSQDKEPDSPAQAFLADLRTELRHTKMLAIRLECVGLAVSKGVLDLEGALDMYATLPKLRSEPDAFTADFMARVMADDQPRRKYRRAA